MVPISSTEISAGDRALLLSLARRSIEQGCKAGTVAAVDPSDYPGSLQEHRATFVTLKKGEALRGCIGSLEPSRAFVTDVLENAYSAAFRDPRFEPVRLEEVPEITISISVLTHPEPIECSSESDLISQLRPGVDGLLLIDGRHRGTFLPAVWESLPDPHMFWVNLKGKAGLPADYWSGTLKVFRYETESFE